MEVSKIRVTYRFGKVERKDPKRNDWPGPADQNLKSSIKDGKGKHDKPTFPERITDPAKLKKLRQGIQKEDNSLGPGQYVVKLPQSAPITSFG